MASASSIPAPDAELIRTLRDLGTDVTLRAADEIERLARDIEARPGCMAMLYRIREALGFNRYFHVDLLENEARGLRSISTEMLAALKQVDDEMRQGFGTGSTDTRAQVRRAVARAEIRL